MPTNEKMRNTLLENLPDLKEGTIIELGSGWGNLLFPISKKYRNCSIIGYENSPIPYLFSSFLNDANNLKIMRHDFYDKSLRDANLIICYLFPTGMERLREKLDRELRPGTKVISHTHAIPGWKPIKTVPVDSQNIYFYEVM